MSDWPIADKLHSEMIRKLEKHRHDRGLDGWKNESLTWLMKRAIEELDEFAADPSWEEAADVANFLAMVVEQSR